MDQIGYLLQATLITIEMGATSIVLATFVGVVLGTLAGLGGTLMSWILTIYVIVVRGVPLLVEMFLFYFGLPFFGVQLPPEEVGILAITFFIAALIGEIVRGGVLAVPKGQIRAAKALGLSPYTIAVKIILPQATVYAIPPYISMLPVTVKATTLASIIGVWELTLAAKEVVQTAPSPFVTFAVVLAIYFCLCYALTFASSRLERRLSRRWSAEDGNVAGSRRFRGIERDTVAG